MKKKYWNFLLLLPFLALGYPPLYNKMDPIILGFPFFYWYQFIWIPLTSLIIWIVNKKGGYSNE